MDNVKKRPLVKFSKRAVIYALLLVFAIIFTQALRATASAVLFWFLALLPVVSLIYVLIGKALIRIYVSSDITKVEKMQPVNYELRIINASPFAYPFIETIVSVPPEIETLPLPFAPFSSFSSLFACNASSMADLLLQLRVIL